MENPEEECSETDGTAGESESEVELDETTPSVSALSSIAALQSEKLAPSVSALGSVAAAQSGKFAPSVSAIGTVAALQSEEYAPTISALGSVAALQSEEIAPVLSNLGEVAAFDIGGFSTALASIKGLEKSEAAITFSGSNPTISQRGVDRTHSDKPRKTNPDWVLNTTIEVGLSISIWIAESIGATEFEETGKSLTRGAAILAVAYAAASYFEPSPSLKVVIPIAMALNMLLPSPEIED